MAKKRRIIARANSAIINLYVLLHANVQTFKEVIAMTGDKMTLEDVLVSTGLLDDILKRTDLPPKWINIGREEGRKEERQRAREGAQKLKQMGVSFDIIATGSGLSFEEIEQL
jgi:hypothetical protein